MRAYIDRDGCISCGLCVDICGNVFRLGDDGIAEVFVEEIAEEDEELTVEAQESCPVSVITVKEEE